MGPLRITDPKYAGHDKKYGVFVRFLPQTGDFLYNHKLTPTDFEQKFEIF
jgi:hypothetical protein